MQLHPLKRTKRGNGYCGPAVLSFVCGISTDEAAKDIRELFGRKSIKGTYGYQLHAAFKKYGVKMIGNPLQYADKKAKPTIAKWLRENRDKLTDGRVFLIEAGEHWQLVTGHRYACGRIGEVVSQRDPRVRRCSRVAAVYELKAA